MATKRKSFILYADLLEMFAQLKEKDRSSLIMMILLYINGLPLDEYNRKSAPLNIAFSIIRAQLDRDLEKYEQKCQRNAENGKLGGRPKSCPETQNNRSLFSKTLNDNNNKNKNENDTATDNDNEPKLGRSFDPDDFFAAAVNRSYGK